MSFECVSWRFNVASGEDRERLCKELRGSCCNHLNLCASAGCACVTGVGEQLCHEADTGGALPVYHAQGPHWSVTAQQLPESVVLTVFYEAPIIPDELRQLHTDLVAQGFPVFYSMYHTGTRF